MGVQPDPSLRVVLMTDFGAQVVAFFNQFLSANGHRLVAVVTTPGPKNRRTDSYLGVVQATPPGIDVIITTHPKRLAPMLRPFKPDLIWVMGFLLRLPEESSSFHGWEPSIRMGGFCRSIVAPTLPAGFSAMTKVRSAGPFIA